MSHRSTTNSTSKFSKDKRNRQREQLRYPRSTTRGKKLTSLFVMYYPIAMGDAKKKKKSKRLDRNQDRMDATQPQNRLA